LEERKVKISEKVWFQSKKKKKGLRPPEKVARSREGGGEGSAPGVATPREKGATNEKKKKLKREQKQYPDQGEQRMHPGGW